MEVQEYCVQKKISCIFETEVVEEKSAKRSQQSYKVVATPNIKEKALQSGIVGGPFSEKLDGTCCYILNHNGVPWLWARFDRKPCKAADKRFKKHQTNHRAWVLNGKSDDGSEPKFIWDLKNDFKSVPMNWIPSLRVDVTDDGDPKPDDIGHTPGWVPVEISSRQYCWHLKCVDLKLGLVLVLKYNLNNEEPMLEIAMEKLSKYLGKTMELIGTNINGNPYKLGSKENPVHLLVPHGEINLNSVPPLDFAKLAAWFESAEGQVEGIVWLTQTGDMYKCNRHHLGLKWPVGNLRLNSLPVKINIDLSSVDFTCEENSLLKILGEKNEMVYNSLQEVTY